MPQGLLLLHAFPLDSSSWEPQVEEFRTLLTVVTPDFPGFGADTTSAHSATIDGAADAAAAALRDAGVDQAVVCGLSMGGYVALAMWRRHTALISGLVLANTRAGADDEPGKERRRALAARLRKEGNGFLAADPPPLLSGEANGELMTLVKNRIASQPPEAIAAAAEAMADRPDSGPDLPTITVPVMVITAEHDTLITPDASKAMADAIPNARYEVIPRSGHLSNLQQPQLFNDLLREHLVRCGFLHEGLPAGVRSAEA